MGCGGGHASILTDATDIIWRESDTGVSLVGRDPARRLAHVRRVVEDLGESGEGPACQKLSSVATV